METHRLAVADAQSIVLDWYPSAPNARLALFVHGLGSHRRGEKACYFAEQFNARGWAFAALDMRGHGEADGSIRELTLSGLLADVKVALRWIAARSTERPVLIGSSMGAAVIAWHALQHPQEVGPLVMIAPSLSFPSGMQLDAEAMEMWRQLGVHRWSSDWLDIEIGYGLIEDSAQYDPARLQRELSSDMLILHGMRDEAIDWRASASFAESCRARSDLVLLKQGDHRLTEYKSFLFDALWAWLQRSTSDAYP